MNEIWSNFHSFLFQNYARTLCRISQAKECSTVIQAKIKQFIISSELLSQISRTWLKRNSDIFPPFFLKCKKVKFLTFQFTIFLLIAKTSNLQKFSFVLCLITSLIFSWKMKKSFYQLKVIKNCYYSIKFNVYQIKFHPPFCSQYFPKLKPINSLFRKVETVIFYINFLIKICGK